MIIKHLTGRSKLSITNSIKLDQKLSVIKGLTLDLLGMD